MCRYAYFKNWGLKINVPLSKQRKACEDGSYATFQILDKSRQGKFNKKK